MGIDLIARLRAAEAEKERWFRARAAQVERMRRAGVAAARRAWNEATRTGADIVARTPEELRALGEELAGVRAPAVPARRERAASGVGAGVRPRAPSTVLAATYRGVRDGAALRGATDELTFGMADRASAAVQATFGRQGGSWGDRYTAEMAEERAQDRYDQEHYGAARALGQVGGAVGSFFIPGGALVRVGRGVARAVPLARNAMRAAKRQRDAIGIAGAIGRSIAQGTRAPRRRRLLEGAAPVSVAERTAWLWGPGAANAAVQGATDLLSGRIPTPQDLGAAFVGGALGGKLRRLDAGQGEAIGAAATSVLQDLANFRMPSV